MQESKIYEIAQMINNRSTVENDLSEAKSMITKMFHDKYINKMHTAIIEKHDYSYNNPTKEVNLLNALKPFIVESKHTKLEQAIEMLTFMNTVSNIKSEVAPVLYSQNVSIQDESSFIHPDGIYEIDESCLKTGSKNQILPLILLMLAQ